MRSLTLLFLVPAALLAGQSRFARLGEFQGQVEVQLTAADPWTPAERNLPLTQSAWVRTGSGARVEIEMDDGSVWRLGPDSQGEISDYSRLSTGQNITLLSLDHGTSYFTGQPLGRDVMMLVVPGAQMTVLQGSRVRVSAQPSGSQVCVLEGQVRFSSPAAEMNMREGTTARVETALPTRFFLYPEVVVEPLDRWSEDRDKVQTAPASAVHVTGRYGVADLDSAGKWVVAPDLGLVWKPEVDASWAPYQKGRWHYYETLGYTWVSDDSWGWLPYHNGRWARQQELGWVWQPAVTNTFHPAEVYWVRGAAFTGWGPLAPGELWIAPNAATVAPQFYKAGNTTYAAFQPDARTIDPAGFPAPTLEELKTVAFIPAPPSPAFLIARLDATRPVLSAGSTRIRPSVPGVTMGDTPPMASAADIMTNPANNVPQPVAADSAGGVTTPPDGVYPVPVAAVPVIEVPVVINPPDHPDYSHRPGSGNSNRPGASGGSTPGSTTPGNQTAAALPAPAAATPPRLPGSNPNQGAAPAGSPPLRQHPADPAPATPPPAATPVNRPPDGQPVRQHPPAPPATPRPSAPPKMEVPKIDPSKTIDKKGAAMLPAEVEVYRQLVQDITVAAPNYNRALTDLTAWTRKFPTTSFETERAYYYVHVYNALSRSELALNAAAPLVSAGVAKVYDDPQRVLQVLVAASSSIQKLPEPTSEQLATGRLAAQQLLEFLPDYFAPRRKPANVTDAAWSIARTQLELVAKQALARRSKTLAAANRP